MFKLSASVFFCFGMAYAGVPSGQLNQELQQAIQTYLTQNEKSLGISAVQLSVLLPTENIPRDYVVGTQYLDEPVPATTEMLMQWGSITKEYTASLIFQLINQGRLALNTTLLALFPEEFSSGAWPEAWQNVTLTELMNMTGGITDYSGISSLDYHDQYTLAELVQIAATYQEQQGCSIKHACFPVGTAWSYSNTNYVILGMVIEKLTGMSFTNVINQKILAPFQNQGDAVYYYASTYPANILANMINGYDYHSTVPLLRAPTDVTAWNMSWAASAGALLGNMDTLVRMTHVLYSNQSIVPASELMQNAVQAVNGQPVTNPSTQCTSVLSDQGICYAMGLGLYYNAAQGGKIWWYQGGTLGYNTIYMWFPAEDVIVAVSQNTHPIRQSLLTLTLQVNTIIRQYLFSQ